MAPLWSVRPFKAIFTVIFVLKSLLYLTICSFGYAVPSLRPFPTWNFRLSLGVKALRIFFEYLTAVGFQQPPQLKPKSSKERFVLVKPPPDELFKGALASSTIKPIPVGVVWHLALPRRGDSGLKTRKVCIHAPGGAMVLGWDPEATGSSAERLLSEYYGSSYVVYVQYRLANSEKHFPAAVQDLLTTYHYVLELGVPAENITLVGDSAGGNLVFALLRYIETAESQLPRPGGAVTLSPWIDVTVSGVKRYEQSPLGKIDVLWGPLLAWGVDSYRPKGRISQDVEAFISPLNHPFATKTPLFLDAGANEGFFDSIREFAEQMSNVDGNRVSFHAGENMPHDYFLLSKLLGAEKEAGSAVAKAREFIEGASE
ncbi:alpha/beta hydrolase fold-3 domain-containing protein [Nemania sp. FL0031]|nr:alpha/beta hydrolase fold-3 domain-containing protein [Nemania sp. FL0031]